MFIYNEADLGQKILEKYNEHMQEFNDDSKTEYIPNKNPLTKEQQNQGRIAKIIISCWLIFIGLVFTIILSLQTAINYFVPIVCIYLGLVSIVVLSLFKYARKVKNVNKVTVYDKMMRISFSNNDHSDENLQNAITYNLASDILHIRRLRNRSDYQGPHDSRPYTITFKTNKKKETYNLNAYDKLELFAFVLFLETHVNNRDINSLSSSELENMYKKLDFGLKMRYSL